MFRDTEKARYADLKPLLFSPAAQAPGTYHGIPRPFCLADGHSEENLQPSVREEAVAYFRARRIPWHDGWADASGNGRGQPSNHLCCSQSFCVNALWPMVRDLELLAAAFRPFLPEIEAVLPFCADQPLADGADPFLAFEWIGTRNYLGEVGNARQRGAKATSADFAFRFRRTDGRVQLALGEWKYTETYRKSPPDRDVLNATRLRVYRTAFDRWREQYTGEAPFPPYEAFFVEPWYQLMRLTLLAQEMELAGSEMGAEVVTVLHVAPRANYDLSDNLSAAPEMRRWGSTLTEAWSHLAPAGRFLSISNEDLLNSTAALADSRHSTWVEYLLQRYGW